MRKKQYDLFVQADAEGKIVEWWLKSWIRGRPRVREYWIKNEREGKGEPPEDVLQLADSKTYI